MFQREIATMRLSSYLKETPKLYIEVCFRIFTSAISCRGLCVNYLTTVGIESTTFGMLSNTYEIHYQQTI